MAGQGVSTAAVLTAAGGALFVWSGIKGGSVTASLRSLLSANPQLSSQNANPITGAAASGGGSGTPGGGVSGTAAGAPSVSGSYSHAQLMQLWQSVGGSAAAANNAACHAIQESSGNPSATSANPDGGTNVGLWQLDTPGGKGAGYSIAQLKNPVINARVAVRGSSNGTDWSAWATPGC